MSRIKFKLSLMRPSNTFQVSHVAPCKNEFLTPELRSFAMELTHGARILMLGREWLAGLARAKGPESQITGVGHLKGMRQQGGTCYKTLSHDTLGLSSGKHF